MKKYLPVKLCISWKYFFLLLPALLLFAHSWAQVKPKTDKSAGPDNVPRPTDVRVLDEHKDKNGNLVRTVQYYQGGQKITEIQTIRTDIGLHRPINPDTLNKDS